MMLKYCIEYCTKNVTSVAIFASLLVHSKIVEFGKIRIYISIEVNSLNTYLVANVHVVSHFQAHLLNNSQFHIPFRFSQGINLGVYIPKEYAREPPIRYLGRANEVFPLFTV